MCFMSFPSVSFLSRYPDTPFIINSLNLFLISLESGSHGSFLVTHIPAIISSRRIEMELAKITSAPVSEIMTSQIHSVTLDQTLSDVNRVFAKYKVRHVPVVKNEDLVGIVSLTDIQRLSFDDPFEEYEYDVDSSISEMMSIDQVMKHNPVTVQPADPILKVATILANAEFHALPVVENNKLVGIVTTTDLIKYFIEKVSNVSI